jgi:hypothetical protein
MMILEKFVGTQNCAKRDGMAQWKALVGAVKSPSEGRVIRVPDTSNHENWGLVELVPPKMSLLAPRFLHRNFCEIRRQFVRFKRLLAGFKIVV